MVGAANLRGRLFRASDLGADHRGRDRTHIDATAGSAKTLTLVDWCSTHEVGVVRSVCAFEFLFHSEIALRTVRRRSSFFGA